MCRWPSSFTVLFWPRQRASPDSGASAPRHAAEYVHSAGAGAVKQEEIVAEVRPAARAKVPDGLKAELLTRIRTALEA